MYSGNENITESICSECASTHAEDAGGISEKEIYREKILTYLYISFGIVSFLALICMVVKILKIFKENPNPLKNESQYNNL